MHEPCLCRCSVSSRTSRLGSVCVLSSILTRGRVTREPDVSIDAENHILDWKLGDRVVDFFDKLFCELLDEAMPVLLRLAEFGVVH